MRRRLLRIPFNSCSGLKLSDPSVVADRTLQYRVLLRQFWTRVRGGTDRLSLLVEYAAKRITAPSTSIAVRRARFTAEGRRFRGCFVCKSESQAIRHHILQLQHGGPNITHNVVNVCRKCHALIHPWLTTAQD